jgi:RimJ/RimL family protein N-acetyltransferase
MGMNRVWATVPHNQDSITRLLTRAGFIREGDLKSHFGRGTHAACYRMLANEFERAYRPTVRAPAHDGATAHMEAA